MQNRCDMYLSPVFTGRTGCQVQRHHPAGGTRILKQKLCASSDAEYWVLLLQEGVSFTYLFLIRTSASLIFMNLNLQLSLAF